MSSPNEYFNKILQDQAQSIKECQNLIIQIRREYIELEARYIFKCHDYDELSKKYQEMLKDRNSIGHAIKIGDDIFPDPDPE